MTEIREEENRFFFDQSTQKSRIAAIFDKVDTGGKRKAYED